MGFEKLKFLGKGSFGSVHLAAKVDDHGFFSSSDLSAVKSANSSSTIPYLMREKRFLEELVGCPFIIQCFGDDLSTEKGQRTYNVMMEYAPGGTLKELMEEKSGGMIPECEVACYAAMLLHGLAIAHSKGTVHCDMKPDNVLVFPMGHRDGVLNHVLKIADFGLAMKVWDREEEGGKGRSLNRGALLYAPPEAVFHGEHSPATDVWSLGCIVVEMLTGSPMWGSECTTRNAVIDKMVMEEPHIPRWVSKDAIDFLKKCLETDPARRWTPRTLLLHPFISSNLGLFRGIEDLIFQRNPFSPSGFCRSNTFSDVVDIDVPSSEEPAEWTTWSEYNLVKEFRKEVLLIAYTTKGTKSQR